MSNEEACSNCGDSSCSDKGMRTGEQPQEYEERQQLARRMCSIKHKILVLSGKGGVGKSTIAVNLAVSLSLQGNRVGLLDVDLHGPSIPRLLNLEDKLIEGTGDSLIPVKFSETLKVMSIGFMLRDRADAVIWRGPRKHGIIKQFLKDVEWGELDYLVVDFPPGTGDESLAVCQLIEDSDGAVIVTTPQEIALLDVRKSITFCKQLNVPVLGVIENMSGFVCPKCAEVTEIFKNSGAEEMAISMDVPFLGRIPLDPEIGAACDEGTPHVIKNADSETAKAFASAIGFIQAFNADDNTNLDKVGIEKQKKELNVKIAIPVAGGKLAMHFGHCEEFALIDIDPVSKTIGDKVMEAPPAHEPGVLPRWLSEKGANIIIAGGMGSRAQELFTAQNIEVIVGAPALSPMVIVDAYIQGTLESGTNVCDH